MFANENYLDQLQVKDVKEKSEILSNNLKNLKKTKKPVH